LQEKDNEVTKVNCRLRASDYRLPSTIMASFSPIKSESFSGLLCALNPSVPTNVRQSRPLLAKSADASKPAQTLAKAAEALTSFPPSGLAPTDWPGLGAPPGLTLPEGFTPPPGLAPPAGLVPPPGLAAPNRSRGVKGRKKSGSGSDCYFESDVEGTSVGTGSISLSGSSDDEDAERVAKEFQMNADAPVFVPGSLSDAPPTETTCRQQKTPLRTPLRKGAVFVPMLSPNEAAGMGLWLSPHGAGGMALPPRPITGSVKKSAQYKNGKLVSLRAERHTPTSLA